MDAKPLDKAQAEEISLGGFVISLVNVTDFWLDIGNQTTIRDIVQQVLHQLWENPRTFGSVITRLVVFTSAIEDEVYRWQDMLGLRREISKNPNGVVGGKIMCWGNGDPKETYAVVIISEWLARDLVGEDEEAKRRAMGLLIHELVHSHTGLLEHRIFGTSLYYLANSDWRSAKRAAASLLWGEYYSESVAAEYYSESFALACLDFVVTLVTYGQEIIEEAKHQFWIDGNMDTLWMCASDHVSQIVNQIGRALGQIQHHDKHRAYLYQRLDEVSSSWTQLVQGIDAQFAAMEEVSWSLEMFDPLIPIVEQAFNSMGLFPSLRCDGSFFVGINYGYQ